MAHDVIKMEPAKAGETVYTMQGHLQDFNYVLYNMGLALQNISASTSSEPLLKAMDMSVLDLNKLGQGVNAGIYAFSHAFVQVIEQWKKTDAMAASGLLFSIQKPQFEEFRLFHHAPLLLHVHIADVKNVIEDLSLKNTLLKVQFDLMDTIMNESKNYWQGQSGDQTRQNWKRHLTPLAEDTEKTVNRVVNIMNDELAAFIKRDATNFPGKW
jgi:hypothetical protein